MAAVSVVKDERLPLVLRAVRYNRAMAGSPLDRRHRGVHDVEQRAARLKRQATHDSLRAIINQAERDIADAKDWLVHQNAHEPAVLALADLCTRRANMTLDFVQDLLTSAGPDARLPPK